MRFLTHLQQLEKRIGVRKKLKKNKNKNISSKIREIFSLTTPEISLTTFSIAHNLPTTPTISQHSQTPTGIKCCYFTRRTTQTTSGGQQIPSDSRPRPVVGFFDRSILSWDRIYNFIIKFFNI